MLKQMCVVAPPPRACTPVSDGRSPFSLRGVKFDEPPPKQWAASKRSSSSSSKKSTGAGKSSSSSKKSRSTADDVDNEPDEKARAAGYKATLRQYALTLKLREHGSMLTRLHLSQTTPGPPRVGFVNAWSRSPGRLTLSPSTRSRGQGQGAYLARRARLRVRRMSARPQARLQPRRAACRSRPSALARLAHLLQSRLTTSHARSHAPFSPRP